MGYFSRADLIEKMKEVALLQGEFTLRGGRQSNWYFDKYRFAGSPGIMRSVAHHMARQIPAGIDRLAGIELGGIPLCTALALETDIPAIFIRRSPVVEGSEKQVEGAYESSDEILIVEDVVTTGGQAVALINELRAQNLRIAGCLAVLDREEGSQEAFSAAQVPFWSLFRREDFGL